MNSMTGFGKAEVKAKSGKLTVEISSVNNRYLEISQRLPRQFFSLEPKLRDLIGSKISRGKVSIYVGFDDTDGSLEQYHINKTAIKAYYRQLSNLQKELKVKADIHIRDLLILPEVAKPEDVSLNEAAVWKELKQVTEKALEGLVAMRKKEGQMMSRDMKKRLTVLLKQAKLIQKMTSGAVDMYREKLTRRVEELLVQPLPDHTRIEEQIALMAEKTDISEECTRFISHIEQYRETLSSAEPIGKRLNFILQEMNREANTIASKATDMGISSTVITVKEEIEKIREMVQNVE